MLHKEKLNSTLSRGPLVTISIIAQIFSLILVWFGSGPLLEGYGISVIQKYGSYIDYFPGISGRPLSILPQYLASTIGGINSFGYSISGIILALIRLFFLIKIVEKNRKVYWVLAPTVIIAPPWLAVSNERFMPAVASFTFVLAAWYFFFSESGKRYLYILFSFLSCLTYPPILLSAVIAYLCGSLLVQRKIFFSKFLLDSFILVLPIFLYLSYLGIQKIIFPNSYDSQFSNRFSTLNVLNIFYSYFAKYMFQSFIFALIVLALIVNSRTRLLLLIKNFFIIYFLMLTSSLVYAQEYLHTNDPERIFFPSSVSLVLFSLLLMRDTNYNFRILNFSKISIPVITSLIISIQLLYWPSIASQNRQFLNAVQKNISNDVTIHSIQIRDSSGRFGDVNTFYSTSLQSALTYLNPTFAKAEICTMPNIARIHPISTRYPLNTTETCKDLDDSFDLFLEVVSSNPLILKKVSPE